MIINLAMNTPESYYKLPLIGITETRARIGMTVHTNYTTRCGSRECWFVGHAATSVDAQKLLDTHTCPTAPARNELPSGYSTIEKLWDEADDAYWAIMTQQGYNAGDRYLDGSVLQGYVRGLCFTLSMMTHPYFRTIAEVGHELQKRYKIRRKELPFEATPTYRFNPVAPSTPSVGRSEVWHGKTVASKSGGTRTAAQTRAEKKASLSKIDLSPLDTRQREQIIQAHTMGMFTVQELAQNYGITPETVVFLVSQRV
jgi:hypothetical protein